MNILRLIRLLIVGVILLFLVSLGVSLLIPSEIKISRAIDIHADKDSVYKLLVNKDNWRLWNPLFSGDNIENYKRIRVTPLTLTDSILLYRFDQNGKKPVYNSWHLYMGGANSVTVQWYIDITLRWYPWEKFKSLFFENTFGMNMEQGLKNLKNRVEGN
jgi:hypothetical protein